MPILVQKFGGTSVANAEKIRLAAQKAIDATKKGYQVIVVAMPAAIIPTILSRMQWS